MNHHLAAKFIIRGQDRNTTRQTLTFIKRRQKWMLNDLRYEDCLLSALPQWCELNFFSSYRLTDREINVGKRDIFDQCISDAINTVKDNFSSLVCISQILISFKKYLKGSMAMSDSSFLATFKKWPDFEISPITLFVNVTTCCSKNWNLSFSLQVHALITFITSWTKLES